MLPDSPAKSAADDATDVAADAMSVPAALVGLVGLKRASAFSVLSSQEPDATADTGAAATQPAAVDEAEHTEADVEVAFDDDDSLPIMDIDPEPISKKCSAVQLEPLPTAAAHEPADALPEPATVALAPVLEPEQAAIVDGDAAHTTASSAAAEPDSTLALNVALPVVLELPAPISVAASGIDESLAQNTSPVPCEAEGSVPAALDTSQATSDAAIHADIEPDNSTLALPEPIEAVLLPSQPQPELQLAEAVVEFPSTTAAAPLTAGTPASAPGSPSTGRSLIPTPATRKPDGPVKGSFAEVRRASTKTSSAAGKSSAATPALSRTTSTSKTPAAVAPSPLHSHVDVSRAAPAALDKRESSSSLAPDADGRVSFRLEMEETVDAHFRGAFLSKCTVHVRLPHAQTQHVSLTARQRYAQLGVHANRLRGCERGCKRGGAGLARRIALPQHQQREQKFKIQGASRLATMSPASDFVRVDGADETAFLVEVAPLRALVLQVCRHRYDQPVTRGTQTAAVHGVKRVPILRYEAKAAGMQASPLRLKAMWRTNQKVCRARVRAIDSSAPHRRRCSKWSTRPTHSCPHPLPTCAFASRLHFAAAMASLNLGSVDETESCDRRPEGEWKPATHTLTWALPKLAPTAPLGTLHAQFNCRQLVGRAPALIFDSDARRSPSTRRCTRPSAAARACPASSFCSRGRAWSVWRPSSA